MEAAVRARKRKPMFAVDIAVPRDIEAEVGELDDVYLYTIDDLDKVVMEGQGNREAAAVDAEQDTRATKLLRYLSMQRAKEVAPADYAALRERTPMPLRVTTCCARRVAGWPRAPMVTKCWNTPPPR